VEFYLLSGLMAVEITSPLAPSGLGSALICLAKASIDGIRDRSFTDSRIPKDATVIVSFTPSKE
jgi:hypothetical protein